MKRLLFLGFGFILMTQASAYEVKKVCAKYQTNYSWSKSYQVQSHIYSGQELNEATGNAYMGKYSMFDHYAVIWWDAGQASIIKLSGFYTSGMMMLYQNGTDQNGRAWQLSDNSYGICI
ncbi:hypothetical protein LU293_01130 [Moraxella nasovis]|uniref:hypothetical protein n=1 Tax=Moraxella nasovis TaxID=2904121 RepID=UPI001F613E20|nr:hypothetical protein [Moraxella nasovis]UNU73546.1 hypothetical protein LU293_01130 [Moraxella nasovis]